jgi:hypothetical protein
LELQDKGGPGIPHLILNPSLPQCTQPPAGCSRDQNGWNLTGASRNVAEILSDEKPRDTQRNRRTQLYFTPAVPDELIFKNLGLQQ